MIVNVAFITISILSLLMIARNKSNKYVWIFAGMFVSLDIIFVSMIFYIIKLSNYYPTFNIENRIFMTMARMNINFFRIRALVNIGVVVFVMSKLCFVNSYSGTKSLKKLLSVGISTMICILYLYFNSFTFVQQMHMLENSYSGQGNSLAMYIIPAVKCFNVSVLAASMLLPYLTIVYHYIHTSISFKKRQYSVLFVFLLIIDLFFMLTFVFGAFKGKVINNIDFDNLMAYEPSNRYGGVIYLSLIFLVIINILYVLMARYRVFDSVNLFKNRIIFKNIKLLPIDIRNINHSYKNSIFAIQVICDEIKESYANDKKLISLINQIDGISNGIMGQLETLANLTNSDIKRITEIPIQSCIDAAVSKLVCKGIEIERCYSDEPKYILAERTQITEAIYNILINSVEAINTAGRTDGRVKISLYSDIDWVCLSVWDNGIGIKKKDIKKLYNPLFTTKKTNKNWGIGLSYSYKVIKAHLGIIFCDSVYGSHTEFQILLPCNNGAKSTIW